MNPGAHHHFGAHHRRHESIWARALHRTVTGAQAFARRLTPTTRAARIVAVFGIVIILAALVVGYLFRTMLPGDLAGPWIIQAIEEKLGPGHRVSIGETQIESDATGGWRLRVRDLVVRGPNGEVLASAPSAEVALEGSLLSGRLRARRIDLIDAELTVQIGPDGRIAVFPGRDVKPTMPTARLTPPIARAPRATVPLPPPSPVAAADPLRFPELIAWLDGLEKSGLDGIALTEVGLKQGTLVVENTVTGKRWTFRDIETHFERQSGGLTFSLASGSQRERWSLTATVSPAQDGARAIDLVVEQLAVPDLLLAAGFDSVDLKVETPISGILRAHIASDGRLLAAAMRVALAPGVIGKPSEPDSFFTIEEAYLQMTFDPERRAFLIEPFAIAASGNRTVLEARIDAPRGDDPRWPVAITRGQMILTAGRTAEPPLEIDRVAVRGNYDPKLQRIVIEQGELSGATAGLALSGSIGIGGDAPTISLGVAATPMSASAFKRLWPIVLAPGVRKWVIDNVDNGVVERALIAIALPAEVIAKSGVVLDDAAVRVEVMLSNTQFRPIPGLPPIRESAASIFVTGRTARVQVARGVVDTPGNRRITLRDGVFEVADHSRHPPNSIIRFRLDGAADAVAELIAMEPLREVAGFKIDPATTKGTVGADVQLQLALKPSVDLKDIGYTIAADVKGFAADRLVRNQRVEAVNAAVTITPSLLTAKGEGQLAGSPATFEIRQPKGTQDFEFRVVSTFDEATRARLGFDLTPWLLGPVSVRANGKVTERETRMEVEADLTAARVSDLVPGWQKVPGRPSRASYRVIERDGGVRIENLIVSGSGTSLRGSLEFDKEGWIVSANLPTFHLSDGDKANLRTERATDGALRIIVRGDVLDARGLMRSMTEGAPAPKAGRDSRPRDIDIDLRLGAATGNNGEVARQVEMRLSRRNGEVRSFALLAKIGADASAVGELRARDGGEPVLYITAGDAGAFFRFIDMYTKIFRGEVWVVIEPPRPNKPMQEGIIAMRDFVIRGEPGLDRLQAAAPADAADRNAPRQVPGGPSAAVFSRLRVHFERGPGRFVIREGVIFGPSIGATFDGTLDYAGNNVHIRGTYIPAYGLNNALARVPLLGYILGGDPNEGVLAVTFEIVGPASRPILRANPMSAVAPGFLRKIFQFRQAPDAPPPAQLPQ